MTDMPRATDRMHLEPYWLGDSPRAIRKCARRLPGKRYIDLNLQRCKNGIVVMHWATPYRNGYTWIQKSNGTRVKMTRDQLHRKAKYWTVGEILTWRRTEHRRRGHYETTVKIMTYEQAVRMCKKWLVSPCFELKSVSFGDRAVARAMVDYANYYGRRVFFMCLVTMDGWRNKGLAIRSAGGHIALLAHGARRPADLDQYVTEVFERVWGSWA